MCGILGVASRVPVVDRSWLSEGLTVIAHRGPDDDGEWWSSDGRVGLGHRRLAILDLSSAGRQPMQYDFGSVTIVFNGEIYNFPELRSELQSKGHSFRSNSDTEVLLVAYYQWGETFLAKLNGMFAFALYDCQRQIVLLARDRAGEKPLFYSSMGGELCFGSELKGLLSNPKMSRRVDHFGLEHYLGIGYVPAGACMLKDVRKLPPAHALLFSLADGSETVWRYWQIPSPPMTQVEGKSDVELVDELEVLLEESVSKQLVADVPVGILLSGGVDSSVVTAMAARLQRNVKTFTVVFPRYSKHNEARHAALIAEHFGTEHLELQADEIDPDVLVRLACQFDEPVIDSSMIPTYLVTQLVRKYCTVALGGDGGDELFGGYAQYGRLLRAERFSRSIPSIVRRGVAFLAKKVLPTGFRGRNSLQVLGTINDPRAQPVATYFDSDERFKLLPQLGRPHAIPEVDVIGGERFVGLDDLVQRITRSDFSNYLPEDILVKIDRASMLNSLEVRSPLLDYRIIEFAFGCVPSRLKVTTSDQKILLKMLTHRLLPAEFERKRKQGFSIPLNTWLKRGHWRELFLDVLLSSECVFDKKAIGCLFAGQDRGRANAERLFGLVLFELWRRRYSITL
jgi:asparagine synthase (glutamine-hydrolysing)